MKDNADRIPISFDQNFIKHYARRLVDDPEIALVELVSNCSDAGANTVEILWPSDQYDDFTIKDDGTGMAYDDFVKIWNRLSYNRREHGNDIEFPSGNTRSNRKLFGKNGKGRFSLFCFNDEYKVETSKGGERCVFQIKRRPERRMEPIQIDLLERTADAASSHETIITSCAFREHIEVDRLIELIGCKFLADPSLTISVNGTPIELTNLNGADRETVQTDLGDIEINMLDSGKGGRTSHPHGVAWHVNGKGVGNADWRDPNRLYTLDARTTEAKRYTFIVVADVLAEFVNSDWTSFIEEEPCKKAIKIVGKYIQDKLDALFYEKRQEHKRAALQANRNRLEALPKSSNVRIEQYIDDLQRIVRTLDPKTLTSVVEVLTKLESASTNYHLLHQLAELSRNELEKVSDILDRWPIDDAEAVLEELDWRLKLMETLEALVDKDASELHEIHPLFEKALWIFGPEYESMEFVSNRTLLTVIRDFLGDDASLIQGSRRRPDLVTLGNTSFRLSTRDKYNDDSDTEEIGKVLIVELKRGKSIIGKREILQAQEYAEEIANSNRITSDTQIECFVLGSDINERTESMTYGNNISIKPKTYGQLIELASARTFKLREKIKQRLSTN